MQIFSYSRQTDTSQYTRDYTMIGRATCKFSNNELIRLSLLYSFQDFTFSNQCKSFEYLCSITGFNFLSLARIIQKCSVAQKTLKNAALYNPQNIAVHPTWRNTYVCSRLTRKVLYFHSLYASWYLHLSTVFW